MRQVIRFTGEKVEPIYPVSDGMSELQFMPNLTVKAGTVLGQVTATSANEVQLFNFTGTVTRGTYTVSIDGIDGGTYTSSALACNITNANLKIALEALLNSAGYVGATVTIANGPSPADLSVTLGGSSANWNMPLMVATVSSDFDDGAATPVAGTLVISTTTAGVRSLVWGPYLEAATDGRNVARAISVVTFRTDNMGRVVLSNSGSGAEYGVYYTSAPAWFKGSFRTTELTGLDANGVSDLGRLTSGTLADGIVALI